MTNAKKMSCRLSILILSVLGISVGPHEVLTRTSQVSRALSPVLSNYEVIRMAPGEIERQVRTMGELRFRFNETDFYFNLEPHDMRSPNYRAVETGPGGVRQTLPPQPVHTFKGVLAGREDTRGRFNLTNGGVEGVVFAPEGWYFVEPLRNYLPDASVGELVIYRHEDIKPGEALKCSVSLPKRLERGMEQLAAQVEADPAVKYEIQVATEADYEYVREWRGSENANREIQGILNQVDEIYQRELLLQIRISFQHTWATQDDPYSTTNKGEVLDEFGTYWNANFADKRNYDLAHMWTGRPELAGGSGRIRVLCTNRSRSYAYSALLWLGPGKYHLTSHEIGHNLGGTHVNQANSPVAGCAGTIMDGGGTHSRLTFCEFSRRQITSRVALNNICLTPHPLTLQPSTGLLARTVSSSRIDLHWRDNSANETGFKVLRRRDGLPEWTEVGTTSANVASFSDGESLLPGTTYRYRVRAFNAIEISAFSNEAVATTFPEMPSGVLWKINTIAGSGVGDDGPAVDARLYRPEGVAVDAAGNLYIADTGNDRIRRVDASGVITTIAGGGRGRDNHVAEAASLSRPGGVAVDGSGNLYIAETSNSKIRRVDATGTITTIAGSNNPPDSIGDNGPAIEAVMSRPTAVAVVGPCNSWVPWIHKGSTEQISEGIAMDDACNLYIADTENHRIRRVDASGTITTVAGIGSEGPDGAGFGGDGGPAVEAQLSIPKGVAVDGLGNLYIADTGNHRIRRVDPSGVITTVAGTGEPGFTLERGSATATQLSSPSGVAVDRSGNLYIADTGNHLVRRVDPSGIITTIVGTSESGYSGDDGLGIQAQLDSPSGVAVDHAGNLYIADTGNHGIRRVDSTGVITTVAGTGEQDFVKDNGPAVDAWLDSPSGVAVDHVGNLYIADTGNHRIRRVDASGTISTVAGTGEGIYLYGGEGGPAVEADLLHPGGVAVDSAGNLYIADTGNHGIRRVDPSGTITTIAGTGEGGYSGDGGLAVKAKIWRPSDVAVDELGNLYIADTWNHRIRRVDNSGTISTVAGTGEAGFTVESGPATAAQLDSPSGVAVGGDGNLYIADHDNHRISQVDLSAETMTPIAGNLLQGYSGDSGPAVEARLRLPSGVAVDGEGIVYVADTWNSRIRQVDAHGSIATIAGTGVRGGTGDGGPAEKARLHLPSGLAMDGAGNVYIADVRNHRIRILTRISSPVALPPPMGLTATAVSGSRVNLSWRDNGANETGFRVQRRSARSLDWVDIGTTAADVTMFSDTGLAPRTFYYYRVRAFDNTRTSAFSNKAVALTLHSNEEVIPPTVTHFTPASGPAGTRVTLAGTGFLGATAVKFNGVDASSFEVHSGMSIEAVVPPGASSGPISVVAPGGTAVSTESFTVTTGFGSRPFVPIVLRTRGLAGSFFTSELTLTNRGTTTAGVNYTYTASNGTDSGTAVDSLAAGRQRVIPDAITYLTSLGVPIGSSSAGGTLMVDFSNLSSPSDAAVTVRVSTPVEEGRAGLAYMGLNSDDLLTGPAFISGLRQNSQDRSNVAVQNAGDAGEGNLILRVTVFSGDPATAGRRVALKDRTLPPGGFYQYNGILKMAGFDNGYVKVERVSGSAPYYAYGVINDNVNSDGSFVFPISAASLEGKRGQTLPVIIETKDFASELTVTNFSSAPKTVDFRFVAEAVETDDDTARFSQTLEAGEQRILPGIVNWMRREAVVGIGAADEAFVGAVFATVVEGDMSGIVMGARTGSPDKRGGQYSLFYSGVPYGAASTTSAWIYGLQQDEENRSNLALVNTGEVDDSSSTFEITIYDGSGESQPRTRSVTLGPGRWTQENGILGKLSQGYVQVWKTSGNNPFVTYGVINDGGKPGERSGDGAFLRAQD